MRRQKIVRNTRETQIELALEIDGAGAYEISTGCGFLDHMLELFTRHGRFDISLTCSGDTHIDDHHTTEDIGIALGSAFKEALGEKKGICRYGSMLLPMDEALVLCALDMSGRAHLEFDVKMTTEKVGTFDTQLVKEFLEAMTRAMGLTLHVKMLAGENTHHIIEAVFKSLGRTLRQACAIEEAFADEIPSTKGVL
ncbi:MAG: imidazoleglycerol-phosphate dehydratase HisB [Bacillota bacterium]|nr:imidazoleglycerol-phosphate dehydratase HisB [Bacillota bacterium]